MQAIRPIKRGNPRENRGESRHGQGGERRGGDTGAGMARGALSSSSSTTASAAPTARLFLALWPDEPVRQALLACRDAWQWGRDAGRVPPRHLHLTLHFLGEVPRARMPVLTDGLSVPLTPFEVVLAPLAVWPNGVAVWEPLECPAPLTRLHDDLGRALQRLGEPIEARPYRPHVTLARRARNAVAPAQVAPLAWPVDRYALVESCAGAPRRYEVLRMYR